MTQPEKERRFVQCIVRFGNTGRPGMIRLVLHLLAITLICFTVGFGILALDARVGLPGTEHFRILNESVFLTPTTFEVPLDNTESASIGIVFGTGDLKLRSGAENLVTSTSYGQDPHLQPVVETNTAGRGKAVKITYLSTTPVLPKHWNVAVTEKVPVALDVTIGTGDMDLDLGRLDLTSLLVVTGVGDGMIDLSGYQGRDFSGTITQNVGDLTIRVPKSRNVTIHAGSGIGDVRATGFMRHDGSYTTTGQPGTVITVTQGVGSVTLEAV